MHIYLQMFNCSDQKDVCVLENFVTSLFSIFYLVVDIGSEVSMVGFAKGKAMVWWWN